MNCSGPFEHRYFPIKMCYGQSQFLGRLIRSPGPPRWRKGSGALEEKGSGVLKEKKTIFFLHCFVLVNITVLLEDMIFLNKKLLTSLVILGHILWEWLF